MKTLGLTGGIGSGKSTVGRIFTMLGATVYDSDSRAKRLMETDRNLVRAIKESFGEDCYTDGKLNRQLLSGRIFNDDVALTKLNTLVHPAVKLDIQNELSKSADNRLFIVESAILFEAGLDKNVDFVVTISAPEELRIKRVMERSGITEEQVSARIAAQKSDLELEHRADYVIINDNRHSLWEQVLRLITTD